jgi:nitronate monooxygenase
METRFTKAFNLRYPIALAPMALAAGGELAAAVSNAGGLGLIGAGYGDTAWVEAQWSLAKGSDIGAGLITWVLEKNPGVLDLVLAKRPRALLISFADPRPIASKIHSAGVPLICQVQHMEQVDAAIQAGAVCIVAQGSESGGHGMNSRATMSLVPEIADRISAKAPNVMLLAAGGIADGRGLAAALALGADGVLIGSRFWASQESLAQIGAKTKAVESSGDETSRSGVFDILRRKNWPKEYSFRTLSNSMTERWANNENALSGCAEDQRAIYDAAVKAGDFSVAHVTVGESVGLIHDIPLAASLMERIGREAEAVIAKWH